MAMAATATASTSASIVRLHNRLTNLSSFDHHLFVTVAIAGAAITRKHQTQILKFKAQNPHLPLLSLRSPSHLCYASSAFESFEDPEENEAIADDEEGHDERAYAKERRLYVGNLPFSMNSSHLAEVFSEAGQVDAVEIIYDRVTDRSRGFAFVTMGSAQDAKEAIRMFDGSQVGGRSVKVNFPEVPRGGEREVMGPKIRNSYRGFIDSAHKIYAGNLSWGLASQGLKDAFADQPGLLSAKVIFERDSGRSRGFGFVTFASAEEAQSALESMDGVEVEGRPLRLNMAAERASPASPLTPESRTEVPLNSEMQSSISAY